MSVGDGYGRWFRGDATSQAFVMETLARLNEQADFVRSGESLDEWETRKRAEFRVAMLQVELAQRRDVGRGYFGLSHFIRESAGALEVNDGHVYDEVATLTPEQVDFVIPPASSSAPPPPG